MSERMAWANNVYVGYIRDKSKNGHMELAKQSVNWPRLDLCRHLLKKWSYPCQVDIIKKATQETLVLY
jgi:hypothetical protein